MCIRPCHHDGISPRFDSTPFAVIVGAYLTIPEEQWLEFAC